MKSTLEQGENETCPYCGKILENKVAADNHRWKKHADLVTGK